MNRRSAILRRGALSGLALLFVLPCIADEPLRDGIRKEMGDRSYVLVEDRRGARLFVFSSEEGDSESNYHLVERRYGSFERTFRLPRSVDTDKVKAKFNSGLLNIDIPKSEIAKKKQIEIK